MWTMLLICYALGALFIFASVAAEPGYSWFATFFALTGAWLLSPLVVPLIILLAAGSTAWFMGIEPLCRKLKKLSGGQPRPN